MDFTVISSLFRRSLEDLRRVTVRHVTPENFDKPAEKTVSEPTQGLVASEEGFRSLFQNVPVGLFRATPSGEIVFANPEMVRILGFASSEEMIHQKVCLCALENEDEESKKSARLLTQDEVHGLGLAWKRRDGEAIFVSASSHICRGPNGEVQFVEGSVEDVTERHNLEEHHLQVQKVQAIGQLAGGVAHDFNNILTAIIGYSELVLNRPGLEDGIARDVREIKSAGERAASLTQQLLAFSSRQPLIPRAFQLNDTVLEMEKMLRRLVGEQIQVSTYLHPVLNVVKADVGQVQQVIMNLVANARDAMRDGGTLTIETSNAVLDAAYARLRPDVTPGRYAVLAVSDNGTGMTAEVKARIFEPFFTTKAPGTGTGLGLATCHGIVKQSGGHIAVYSEFGHGTTIKVYLPCADTPVEEAVEETVAPVIHRGSETVLLVEDEPMVRELGRVVLSSLGYEVIEASNGVEALRQMNERGSAKLDLIVTDVVMPEMGGRELAERVRVLWPETRVLFSSGYTFDAVEQTEPVEEEICFLQKPYTMIALAGKVREVLDREAEVHGRPEPLVL